MKVNFIVLLSNKIRDGVLIDYYINRLQLNKLFEMDANIFKDNPFPNSC